MRNFIFLGLTLMLAIGIYVGDVSVAGATAKKDPQDAMTECARAWNSCWDKCKSRKCYRRCNTLYHICIKIEIPG